ncbi:GNAT family N-acetyltransferase [Pseudonocardia sp.]|uniref:GNAT family N-acetyltransferase n=1 Tax=Pseudonocardia sp. TaxID=60912 RepID=UPI003D14EB2E
MRDVVRAAYREFAGALEPRHRTTLHANLDALVATVDVGSLVVAEAAGAVVGCGIYLAPRHPQYLHVPQDWAVLRGLAVLPGMRRRGVARALTTACLDRATEDGAPHVGLHTAEAMLPARALYASLGFVEHGEFPHLGVRFLVYRLDRVPEAPISPAG